MNKVYGVALIGCGQMGSAHLDNIYLNDNVKIKYVCDIAKEKSRIFKKKYNAKYAETNAEKCISADDVDIVIIATYPSSHLMLLKKCIKYKKHVICEKPIATNYEEELEFVRLVKNNTNIKVMVGHILRHNNTYKKVAKMIQSGAIGSPIFFRMVQNHHTVNWNRYLELIKQTSPIIDCGVHYIDIAKWFTGEEIISASGIGFRTEKDLPNGKYNYGLITFKMSGGSTGYYEAGWGNTVASDNLKEFIGPKGRIKITYKDDRNSHKEEGDLIEYYQYPNGTYKMINVNSTRKSTDAQFNHLIHMIEKDEKSTPTIDEVFDCFKIAITVDQQIITTL